ncbi:MAG: ABC transporter ATP-binding protein [Bacteroidota bacterium]|nr:ABC transporter ATP-binding protein [Bacteroidota bacterium]
MREFFKVLKYIVPYWFKASLNVIFNIFSALFALFSFTMTVPFLRILFDTQSLVLEKVPLELTKDSLGNNLNYLISYLITNYGKGEALLYVSIGVIAVTFLKASFRYLANHFIAPVRTGVEKDIRNDIYRKILKLPLSYYTEARKGDVISRISTDVKEVEVSIMSSLEMVFRDPITILIFLTSMFVINVKLSLVALVLLPVSGILIGRIGKKLKTTAFKGRKKMGILISVIEETLTGLRIIKAFNAEEHFEGVFGRTNNTFARLQKKVHRRRYLANPLSEFLSTSVMMVLMFYGGNLVLSGNSDLSSELFIAYIIIFSQVIVPAKSVSTAYFNIQKGLASMDRINYIFSAEETIKDVENPVSIFEFKDSIEFRNVDFRYNTEPVLKKINLKVKRGQTIALVGQSGGGKSTLADLVPRFIDPGAGEVLLDGIPIKQYKIADLRNLMGIVNQEPILFNDSFYNNIAFGVNGSRRDAVINAARAANAHDFIMETPDGYESNIGERGAKLSGGQKQRLSIARALLKDPPILIFDEATSSLDTESERLVQDAIEKLKENRTILVIAHRLSTIKNADMICVIHEGEIVESGKHKELLAKKGYFYKLHNLQVEL